jgi:alpha-tubulin suppressor-like RCC1 family protein
MTYVLRTDGAVLLWTLGGGDVFGTADSSVPATPEPVAGLTNVISIAMGEWALYALKADGTIWSWGRSTRGVLGLGDAGDQPTPVQIGSLANIQQISTSRRDTACAVSASHETWCWGEYPLGNGMADWNVDPVRVPVASKVVAAGHLASCALELDAGIACWGWNASGQLGTGGGANELTNTPVSIASANAFAAISPSTTDTACAVTASGDAYCWGYNDSGQAAVGATTLTVPVPTLVTNIKVESVSTSDHLTCFVTTDHRVACAGTNGAGAFGGSDMAPRRTPVPIDGLYQVRDVDAVSLRVVDRGGNLWVFGSGYPVHAIDVPCP